MTPPGHLAMAYFAVRQTAPDRVRPGVAALAMLGALLPDFIDKTLLVVGVFPWGRTVGHSLIVWALLGGILTIAFATLRPWPPARGLGIGVGSHFVADAVDDVFAGFLQTSYPLTSWFAWPVANPDQWEWRVLPLLRRPETIPTMLEIAAVTAVVMFMVWDARRWR